MQNFSRSNSPRDRQCRVRDGRMGRLLRSRRSRLLDNLSPFFANWAFITKYKASDVLKSQANGN